MTCAGENKNIHKSFDSVSELVTVGPVKLPEPCCDVGIKSCGIEVIVPPIKKGAVQPIISLFSPGCLLKLAQYPERD